ncbi:MAG: hypothetical protein AAGE84_14655 [Cyanobacteria bacterium P01_G01_bin.39]
MNALIKVAKDSKEAEIILASCGESIAEIILRRKLNPAKIIKQLAKSAQNEAEALIKTQFSKRDHNSQRLS